MDSRVVRHTAWYFLARGGAGLLGLATIAVYSRLLPPAAYGRYALVVAGVGLCNVIVFQWMRLSMMRFFPACRDDPSRLLGTVMAGYVAMAALTGAGGIVLALVWPDPTWRTSILIAIPLLWALAWLDLTVELFRIQLRPLRYGVAAWVKTGIALGTGAFLIHVGLGAAGPLLGVTIGASLAGLVGWRDWRGVRPHVDSEWTRQLLRYGLPLTAALALEFVVSTSDRLLLAWISGEKQAGLYSAGYDLGQQSLGLMMMIVTLAVYPLVVRGLEKEGKEVARNRLRQNATLLLALGVPAGTGIAMLAPNVASLLLGADFREQGALVLPWIALATVLAGLKAYHFDVAFHLGRKTLSQVWVSGAAAAANLALNLWWIPSLGLLGAALATVLAYLIGLAMSIAIGRRVFPVPFPVVDAGKIVLAAMLMAGVLWPLVRLQGLGALAVQVSVGGIVYLSAAVGLNVGGTRSRLVAMLRIRRLGTQ